MNILVLNGSPKGNNSNTLKITNSFLNGLNKNHNHYIENINIKTMDINHCLGCFSCWTKTPGNCVIEDDMSFLLEKYIKADLVIWSFPLYYFGMPSKLKSFLDRLLPIHQPFMDVNEDGSSYHIPRYDLSHQRHILISTCGFCSIKNNYEGLLKQFEIICNGNFEKIICPEGELLKIPELTSRINEYLSYVEVAGYEYETTGSFSSDIECKLNTLLYPQDIFLEMANSSFNIAQESTGSKCIKSSKFHSNRTNMNLFLLPWIILWILLPINTTIGALISIVVSSTIPLLGSKYTLTIYDKLSPIIVTLISLASLFYFKSNITLVMCSSYFLFGLIWLTSVFIKIPLSANYSCVYYGGKATFNDPIFIRTNKILTLAWGVLYIITPGYIYFIMNSSISSYCGLITSLLPALMGFFTVWFQKWYPAKLSN